MPITISHVPLSAAAERVVARDKLFITPAHEIARSRRGNFRLRKYFRDVRDYRSNIQNMKHKI